MTRGGVVKEENVKNIFDKPNKYNSPPLFGNNRSLIVFLNNLSEDQINYILSQLKNFSTIKEQLSSGNKKLN